MACRPYRQRARELALLRIVGASRRQVFGSVLAEAALTGLVSSVIGLGLGVLAALGLEALLRGFGITLPSGSLVFEPRTVLVGLAVGFVKQLETWPASPWARG